MRKTNVIAIVILLSLLGMFFYRSYFYDNASKNSITVFINDEGFVPDKIIVSQGTTVIWINQGEHAHWPASNFHPTHTLYPEPGGCIGSKFDACRGLLKGESFSFKFDRLGSWPMHDHLFPGLTMVVEVINDKSLDQNKNLNANTSVNTDNFKNLAYNQQINIIKSMAEKDSAKSWIYLKQVFIVNGQVVGNAHEFAHIVGNKTYEKFGLDGIKICDETFAFGCFHGVTEEMLLKQGGKDLVKSIQSIESGCLKIFPPEQSQNYTGCIHGTGHGLYGFEGGVLKKALADCDIMGERYRPYCYDGVFMENSAISVNKVFDEKNPWKLCTDLDERYHRNCARYQSQVFLGGNTTPSSLSSVGKNCAKGPSTLLRETCYESLGYYVAQQHLGKVADIKKDCELMPNKKGVEICIKGGAMETIFQKYAK